jgi:hypothetical protein
MDSELKFPKLSFLYPFRLICASCIVFKYKETSIILVTGATIWKKTNFLPTGCHHPRTIPLSARMYRYQRFCHFLNASWKSCSVRVFSIACDSATITSIVSKWRPFNFIFNRRNRESRMGKGRQPCWFSTNFPREKEV